jgi:hypothetical protein
MEENAANVAAFPPQVKNKFNPGKEIEISAVISHFSQKDFPFMTGSQ